MNFLSTLSRMGLIVPLIAISLALFAGSLRSNSVDLVSHFALVDELMKHGRVRPEDTHIGWAMLHYPPASHWAAALLGKVTGSGLLALSLISVACVYLCYFSITYLVIAESYILALIVFVGLFTALASTRALVGWEIVINFFYPQLVASALYFLALAWCALRNPPLRRLTLFCVLFIPAIYLVQPIGGVHFTATFLTIVAADALGKFLIARQFSLAHLLSIAAIAGATILTILLPVVRALMSYSSNDGALEFSFSNAGAALALVACLISSLTNLTFSIRNWPNETIDRMIGAAGTASAILMALQFAAFTTLGSGSIYAVKKHVFVVVTLGIVNLARLIGKSIPKWKLNSHSSTVPAVLAFCATAVVYSTPKTIDIKDATSIQRFAASFSSEPGLFKPENTSSFLYSASPTVNALISTTSFLNNIDDLHRRYGKPVESSQYLLVDFKPSLNPSCIIRTDNKFAIAVARCMRTVDAALPGKRISFSKGGDGSIFLDTGWAEQEAWGVWGMEHPILSMYIPPGNYRLSSNARSFLSQPHPAREFAVMLNGRQVATWSFNVDDSWGMRFADLPASAIPKDGLSKIEFISTTPLVSPEEVGVNSDPRKLGIGLFDIELNPEGPQPTP